MEISTPNLFSLQTPHDSERSSACAGTDKSALFHRFDGIAIGRQRAYFFIIFQPPQDWVAAEGISFKLVSTLDVREQVLFRLREFGREIGSFLFCHFSRPFAGGLVHPAQLNHRGLGSAADPITLPKLKPRTMRQHFVVPAIRSRDVACTEWSNVRRFEHFL